MREDHLKRNRPAGTDHDDSAGTGTHAWVRAAGNEQARRGNVQVIAVTPGRVATTMHEQLRAAPDDQFPDRPEFIRLHEEGLLSAPRDVAGKLWSLLDDPGITPGQVLDLREYPSGSRPG